ncbi:hypothetical protein V6N11_060599 [Hibiscus sabdariffa]|uniref:Reverse transcriptase zinc-binding domain-containing protein n=1 Tax=Hibiscus sabdariffa TaxID=183260 RepID=A0ABR2QQT1_9ROSI
MWDLVICKFYNRLASWKANNLSPGGLGIQDLDFQNRALLCKWVWKFANEGDGLWKKVICSKLNLDLNSLVLQDSSDRNVNDGRSILFWSDVWVGSFPLKSLFPRIFALSHNKKGKIAEFGSKFETSWIWDIPLRRRLFDWEVFQWEALLGLLQNFKSEGFRHDSLVWAGSSDGCFSVNSCGKFLFSFVPPDSFWTRIVWLGLAPPKVEFFLWQVLKNRILVKAELAKRGPPILAELLALKFGLSLFCSLKACEGSCLIVESDCKSALRWIVDPILCPGYFSSLIGEIISLGKLRGSIFRFVPRSGNVDADCLAKQGIG